MIPLRAAQPVRRFPWTTVALLALWTLAEIASRFMSGGRDTFLRTVAFDPSHPSLKSLTAILFHGNVFSLCVSLIFSWAFVPVLWERRGALFMFLSALSGALISLWSYAWIHPHSVAPVLAPQACLGAWMGAFMRRDIWGFVDTWVIGPGWVRVLEVPSYVLLFFWFFYLLIGNLLTDPPFSDAPLLYWIPFISFLWGFVLETVWEILIQWTSNSSSNGRSEGKKS